MAQKFPFYKDKEIIESSSHNEVNHSCGDKITTKIEIRKSLAAGGTTEEKIAFSPHFATQVLVRGFTLNQMFKSKVSALLDRVEIRDAFDLEFLARRGVDLDLSQQDKKKIIETLSGFTKRDFSVKLGSVLLSEARDYYNQKRFTYLEEKLTFDKWST